MKSKSNERAGWAYLIEKPNNPQAHALAQTIFNWLVEEWNYGATFLTPIDTLEPDYTGFSEDPNPTAIVCGGDGTFLQAARYVYAHNIPLIGVNLGRLGFLTELNPNDLDNLKKLILCALNRECETEQRLVGQVTHLRKGKKLHQAPFINEAALTRSADDHLIHYTINVGKDLMTSAHGDGILVSTPTGSTAYNMSAGGPILQPGIQAFAITPICPHNLSFRPIIVKPDAITLKLESKHAVLTLDGQKGIDIQQGDEIVIEPAANPLTLLHPRGRNFYTLLREKLGWTGR